MMMALLINGVVVMGLVLFLWSASPLLGPKRRMPGDKGMPYETGMKPLEPAIHSMWVSYYRYAVLFVILDVDVAFLIPWVLLRRDLTLVAMLSMSLFLFLIGLTLAYVWSKGALKCD